MNNDAYILSVLTRHQPTYSFSDAQQVQNALAPTLGQWAGSNLVGTGISGSLAKGTGISGTTDIDILVSLRHDTPYTLKQISDNLFTWLQNAGYAVERQNVSVAIKTGQNNNLKIDIVPARRQNALSYDHWLWSHRRSTHTQTNVNKHIQLVANSGRINEIKALKIWRKQHGLDFPSFLLEMSVLQALSGFRFNNVADNVAQCLRYVQNTLPTARIIDPANSNNNVTDDLTIAEKQALSRAAATSLAGNWNQVIW